MTTVDKRQPVTTKRSARVGLSRPLGLLLALGVLLLMSVLSIMVGSTDLGFGEVFRAVFRPDDPDSSAIVQGLRMPRTGFGLAVGAALGLAGALMQGVTRNALADPGILGVTSGAAFGVTLSALLGGLGSFYGYVWFAFAGALLATVVVFGLGSLGRDGARPAKLALAGAAVSAMLNSMVSAVLLLDAATLNRYRFWAVGAINGQDPKVLAQLLPFLLVGAVLAFAVSPALNSLALGEDVAKALGHHVGRIRVISIIAITLLAGAAAAACGPMVFLGLVVPHMARQLTGPDHRWVLVYSAVLAPILLLAADILGRVLARPEELQVGIIVACLGAPFFIALVRRQRLPEL
ncbi:MULTISPECIES: iron ABC transporter permease [unclassified Crossiella]|uniref:FecCD family ABC transporter permease n=1 Tax=unclassified Crossiella TaxID=2620835 RepID=UPI001FFFA58E|nr:MULTISPECIES: iron ABC transporter permease [unclassified Crossiella]MCK2244009.1 iron ABC transporter permease [Crossiella sp. S99.2]MCK2257133.1 iron ABC transporter permease [Crossiella sp. S99.1]